MNARRNRYADVIKAAKATPEDTKTREPEPIRDELVNLSIKVPKSARVHWLVNAKMAGTSLTAAITEALEERFGVPS